MRSCVCSQPKSDGHDWECAEHPRRRKARLSVLPKRVRLGKNFVIECKVVRPKVKGVAPTRYEFNVRPVVKGGKKYRTYSCRSFPGVVQMNFVEVKP